MMCLVLFIFYLEFYCRSDIRYLSVPESRYLCNVLFFGGGFSINLRVSLVSH